MAQQDKSYFAQRAAEEMELAAKAASPTVQQAHQAMLRAYLERASVGDRERAERPVVG